jgi:hypothetical protein
MSPSSRSRWYRGCQRTKRHRLVSNWRCLRGAGGPHSIQSGRSFPRTGSCVHIRRAPLREETLMEKEAEMPVTADQRPPWNTQRRPEDGSPRSTAAAACRGARRVCRGHASAPMAARWDGCPCRRACVLRPAMIGTPAIDETPRSQCRGFSLRSLRRRCLCKEHDRKQCET